MVSILANVESTSRSTDTIEPDTRASERIEEFVREQIDPQSPPSDAAPSAFWERINTTSTSLWLDSGDIEAIDALWNLQFSGLTTNNTLLNKEVQNGTYDELVPRANKLIEGLSDVGRVRELAFILNLCHARKLVQQFRCDVSVELHTDVAHYTEVTLAYARRCHAICPERFIVKVPLTPAGLVAIAQLREEGVRVNCTLGFSARQNHVATALSRPSFVNVFLGRLNSYVADNQLGSGEGVGEKTTLASQNEVQRLRRDLAATETRQIAASLRDAAQLPRLAGVDVITMPTKVARQAEQSLDQPWRSHLDSPPGVELFDGVDPETVQIEKLWQVGSAERDLVQQANRLPPANAVELQQMASDFGIEDLFPDMAKEELQIIENDGKVPKHRRWQERIARGDLAVDSLMTLAGLA
ncbi:MAG: transaldolase family protein, partial [Novipirellula sp. JB048]